MEKWKDKLINRKPDELVTPELTFDVDAFNKCCTFNDNNLLLLTDFEPNINENNQIEEYFSGVYFDRLTNALRVINEMIEMDQNEMIGFELITSDNTVDIFPNTLDSQWVNAKHSNYFNMR